MSYAQCNFSCLLLNFTVSTGHLGQISVPNLPLTCKQKLHFSIKGLYWNTTFVLMSTGGLVLPDVSPCTIYWCPLQTPKLIFAPLQWLQLQASVNLTLESVKLELLMCRKIWPVRPFWDESSHWAEFFYRVTIPLVQNLSLNSNQKFCFGLACPGLAKAELLFWTQREVLHKLLCHPIQRARKRFANLAKQDPDRAGQGS